MAFKKRTPLKPILLHQEINGGDRIIAAMFEQESEDDTENMFMDRNDVIIYKARPAETLLIWKGGRLFTVIQGDTKTEIKARKIRIDNKNKYVALVLDTSDFNTTLTFDDVHTKDDLLADFRAYITFQMSESVQTIAKIMNIARIEYGKIKVSDVKTQFIFNAQPSLESLILRTENDNIKEETFMRAAESKIENQIKRAARKYGLIVSDVRLTYVGSEMSPLKRDQNIQTLLERYHPDERIFDSKPDDNIPPSVQAGREVVVGRFKEHNAIRKAREREQQKYQEQARVERTISADDIAEELTPAYHKPEPEQFGYSETELQEIANGIDFSDFNLFKTQPVQQAGERTKTPLSTFEILSISEIPEDIPEESKHHQNVIDGLVILGELGDVYKAEDYFDDAMEDLEIDTEDYMVADIGKSICEVYHKLDELYDIKQDLGDFGDVQKDNVMEEIGEFAALAAFDDDLAKKEEIEIDLTGGDYQQSSERFENINDSYKITKNEIVDMLETLRTEHRAKIAEFDVFNRHILKLEEKLEVM